MKRFFLSLAVLLFFGSSAVFSGGQGQTSGGGAASSSLKVYQSQPEYNSAMPGLIAAFQKSHPNIKAELLSSPIVLQEAIAIGELPDIFYTEGYTRLKEYENYIRDVSDQSWVKNLMPATLSALTYNEKPYGMPISLAGMGVIYNKKMFAQHGWKVPETWTEFINLMETIKKAGITPLVNEFGDNWYLGGHFHRLILGNMQNTQGYLDKLFAGQTKISDSPEMKRSFDILDTMLKYGQNDPLAYFWNETAAAFAMGEAAMFMGGDWYWDTLYALDPTIDCGMFAFPVQENRNAAKLLADVSWIWHISKNSPNQAAAMEFLNWMATDPEAKRIQLEVMGIVPGFKGWEFKGKNKLAAVTLDFFNKDMVYPWWDVRLPTGFSNAVGAIYQKYIGKEVTRDQALKELDDQWALLNK